jgi:integrase/recombinase XerD
MNSQKAKPFYERFLTSLESAGKSDNTIRNYRADLRAFEAFTGRPAETATADELDRYFEKVVSLAPASRARKQAALSSFFRWACKKKFIQQDPMYVIDRVNVPKKQPRPISAEILHKILAQIPQENLRDLLLINLLLETGLRISEALSIEIGNMDLSAGDESVLIRGKGGSERWVPLYQAENTLKLLPGYLEGKTGFLFPGEGENPVCYRTIHERWGEYQKKANLSKNAGLHALRHTCATNLLESGKAIEFVKEVLGHKHMQTTLRYTAVRGNHIKKALMGTN